MKKLLTIIAISMTVACTSPTGTDDTNEPSKPSKSYCKELLPDYISHNNMPAPYNRWVNDKYVVWYEDADQDTIEECEKILCAEEGWTWIDMKGLEADYCEEDY